MSNSSIMSIRELIDSAFGDDDINIINFKIIQTVLLILARQLRVLERQVEVVTSANLKYRSTGSTLSITEVKLQTNVPKKTKKPRSKTEESGKSAGRGKAGEQAGAGIQSEKESRTEADGRSVTSSKGGSGSQTTTHRQPDSMGRSEVDERTGADGRSYPSSRADDSGQVSLDDQSTTSRHSHERPAKGTHVEEHSYEKGKNQGERGNKSSKQQEELSVGASITGKQSTIAANKMLTSHKTESSKSRFADDKTVTEIPTKTGTGGVSFSDKTSSNKVNTLKSSTDVQKSSTDKLLQIKGEKDSIQSPTDQVSPTKTSDPMSSSSKKPTASKQQTTVKSGATIKATSSRTDSYEEGKVAPSPMRSVDNIEKQYEKLLIVEHLPKDKMAQDGRTTSLSIVTQSQFDVLVKKVIELEDRFGPGLSENTEMMDNLRRGASMADARAAVQLSARLETAERTLAQMLSLLTELGKSRQSGHLSGLVSQVISESGYTPLEVKSKSDTSKIKHQSIQEPRPSHHRPALLEEEKSDSSTMRNKLNWVTYEQLDHAMQLLFDDTMNTVTGLTNRTTASAEAAFRKVTQMDLRLDEALSVAHRMENLESAVAEYSAQVNNLDANLSAQMTNYQEMLTQMQHDLEGGLETMAEAIANQGGDEEGVAELNGRFTNLQNDLDLTTVAQKDLKEFQEMLSLDLQDIWRQIEKLREIKSDRDEVTDALKDKAGLGALNCLVTQEHFGAVRGDFEKRILSAYEKFNSQELTWQKAIYELQRMLDEKADLVQVVNLREDINTNLNMLKDRAEAIFDIVGEPRAAAVTKKLFRDTACISCSTPAQMLLEEPGITMPALPGKRSRTIGAEATKQDDEKLKDTIDEPKEGGDGFICYAGRPVTHPTDARAEICRRYCGGAHTRIHPGSLCRAPPEMILQNAVREATTAIGTDGRAYHVDEPVKMTPCIPCNLPKVEKEVVTEKKPKENWAEKHFDTMSSLDFKGFGKTNSIHSVTPPMDYDDN